MNRLNYSTSVLLYLDKPEYGIFLRLIFMIPAALLIGSLYLFLTDEIEGSLFLLLEAFIIGMIFWAVFPREYRVYEDHLRIVLGGPFSVNMGFEKIKLVRISSRSGPTVNWVTRITRKHVEIVPKRGFSIAITPSNNELFIENANRAFEQWSKRNSESILRQTR